MPSHTLTATTWGELTSTWRDDGRVDVRCACKVCGEVTHVTIDGAVNPFTVQPQHQAGCRLFVAPEEAVAPAVAPEPVALPHVPWWALVIALLIVILIAGWAGHAL